MNNFIEIPVDVLELLPWYLTDKLSVEERLEFENALEIYPELQNQLELERQMVVLVSADKSLLSKRILETQEERLKLVFNKIDNPNTQVNSSKTNNVISLVDKLTNDSDTEISDPDSIQHFSRVASVGILVLSLATLSSFMMTTKTETSDFIPASAKVKVKAEQITSSSEIKATILVGFSGTADQLKNNKSLKDKLIDIQSAPDNEGIFQINFKQAISEDEIQQIIDSLQAQEDAVWFAGEAY